MLFGPRHSACNEIYHFRATQSKDLPSPVSRVNRSLRPPQTSLAMIRHCRRHFGSPRFHSRSESENSTCRSTFGEEPDGNINYRCIQLARRSPLEGCCRGVLLPCELAVVCMTRSLTSLGSVLSDPVDGEDHSLNAPDQENRAQSIAHAEASDGAVRPARRATRPARPARPQSQQQTWQKRH